MDEKEKKNNENRTSGDGRTAKKLATASLAIATAIGAAAAADMPPSYDEINMQTAVVQDIGDMPFDAVNDAADDQDEEKQKKRITIGSVIMAPLYFAGLGILKLFDFLIGGVVSPIAAGLLRWAFFAVLVVGVLAAGLKCAFPDVPLAKLLTPKRVVTAVGGVTVISIICSILPVFGVAAAVWAARIQAVAAAILVASVAFFVFRISRRRKNTV